MQSSRERLARLVEQLESDPALAETLPSQEGVIVRAAVGGQSVHEIAQAQRISEEAVWRVLSNAARLASGRAPAQRVETGGLGSDTDPGVTGGYGDTGFGSIGNEPDEPIPEEPPVDDGGTRR